MAKTTSAKGGKKAATDPAPKATEGKPRLQEHFGKW